MPERPRLSPEMADVRRAVRELLTEVVTPGELVLVALSGGADSLALAAATAFEAPQAGLHAGAVVIDHGLQAGSAEVAARAAEQAKALGLDPVVVHQVKVVAADGPEADARSARYAGLESVRSQTGAGWVLLGHTLDDQAESVLLGLTRGAGATSLAGMRAVTGALLRPLLGIRRAQTVAACEGAELEYWSDPHNDDPQYTRVRIRREVMPVLERELGPGVAEALARTADQLREDAAVLDALAAETLPQVTLGLLGETGSHGDGLVGGDTVAVQAQLDVTALATLPVAVRNRVLRLTALNVFGVNLSAAHTAAVARLVTHWHGQGEIHVPGIRVERTGTELRFTAAPKIGK